MIATGLALIGTALIGMALIGIMMIGTEDEVIILVHNPPSYVPRSFANACGMGTHGIIPNV